MFITSTSSAEKDDVDDVDDVDGDDDHDEVVDDVVLVGSRRLERMTSTEREYERYV